MVVVGVGVDVFVCCVVSCCLRMLTWHYRVCAYARSAGILATDCLERAGVDDEHGSFDTSIMEFLKARLTIIHWQQVSICDHLGCGRLGVVLGLSSDRLGVAFGLYRDCLGIILFGVTLRSSLGRIGVTL